MRKIKSFFSGFNWLGFLMLCVCVVLGVGDVSGSVLSADGVATDLAEGTQLATGERSVLETSDYRKWSPDLIKDPVDQKVVQIRPYATPLDTIMRYFGTDKINNLEFDTYSISARELQDKVKTWAQDQNNDYSDSSEGCTATLSLYNYSNFDVTDTIVVDGQAGADGNPLQLYVYSKNDNDKTFRVTIMPEQAEKITGTGGGADKYKIPDSSIAVNTVLYAMGRASAETDVLSPAVEYLPKKKHGYCQIFKCQISMSNYAKMADKEIKWDLNEIEEEALFDFRRRQEVSFLRGLGGKTYDPVKKKWIYTTNGLINSISNTHTVYAGAQDGNAQIIELAKHVFVGNSGSTERFAIAGSEAIARLSKLQGIQKTQDAVKTEVIFGITWSKIVTNFGTINLAPDPELNEIGLSDRMIVIDPQFLKKKQVVNFERQQIDGKEHAITNGDLVVFTEAAGLAVYNPNVHSVVIVSASAS